MLLLILLLPAHLLTGFLVTSAQTGEVQEKCTSRDTREIYPDCMQGSNLVLWCDYTNFTEVPDPDKIYDGRSCTNSIALYLNDSCIVDVTEGGLAKYENIECLECGKNRITRIPRGAFKANTKLRKIDLSTNFITDIEDGAFEGLRELEILKLGNNFLKEIHGGMFRGLESLLELSLHNNRIEIVKSGSFVSISSLAVLFLTANGIISVEENAFLGMENLTRLHLDGNQITALSSKVFNGLPNLEELTISYNRLTLWHHFQERKPAKIVTLNLAHNQLQSVHRTSFMNLHELQNLHLENNYLTSLPENTFKNNRFLGLINLSNNTLQEIRRYTFFKLCHLEGLKLANNGLEKIYTEWFQHIIENGRGEEIDINGNDWSCDCHANRLKKLVGTKMTMTFNAALNLSCFATYGHNGADETCEEKVSQPQIECDASTKHKRKKETFTYDPSSVKKRSLPDNAATETSFFKVTVILAMLTIGIAVILYYPLVRRGRENRDGNYRNAVKQSDRRLKNVRDRREDSASQLRPYSCDKENINRNPKIDISVA